ncbi:MAG: helix-turn-helix domain-containing protein [Verrucomicrobia bacterium]|nr:MAG: helix-turn-helix domain-containing protein [Verrucomicrobiota bacterium]
MKRRDSFAWAAGLRRRIVAYLSSRGDELTAEQLAARFEVNPAAIRPRLTELAELGLVRDTGRRVPSGGGRPAIVWAIADPLNPPGNG